MHISNFPHLTREEFLDECTHFLETRQRQASALNRPLPKWILVQTPSPHSPTLDASLTLLGAHRLPPDDEDDPSDDFIEHDPEALPPTPPILYHILYSDIYHVPVLYLNPSLHALEPLLKSAVGGSVSQGEHLLSGEAWWFVHPCQTGEAMGVWRNVVEEGGKGTYIGLWLGIVAAGWAL